MPQRTAHAIADADDPDQIEDGADLCPRCGEQIDGWSTRCECDYDDDLDALADRLGDALDVLAPAYL